MAESDGEPDQIGCTYQSYAFDESMHFLSPDLANHRVLMMKYTFETIHSVPESLGFDLLILNLRSTFVAVKSVQPNSQANKFGITPGDILVSANGRDLRNIKQIDKVTFLLGVDACTTGDKKHKRITITFARQKNTFKILVCDRAGYASANGKYSIQGMHNGVLCLAKNDDINFKIMRIYVNEEDDEAIWALRQFNYTCRTMHIIDLILCHMLRAIQLDIVVDIHAIIMRHAFIDETEEETGLELKERDHYIVLARASDELPPECGWEAVRQSEWPAVGIQYFDVKVVPPSKPRIIRIQQSSNAVEIHFECDEDGRKPRACANMECWYEIEMKHYIKHNVKKGKTFETKHITKVWRCFKSPFMANQLMNGDDYEFIVHNCNHVATTSSDVSERITAIASKNVIIEQEDNHQMLFVN
eukprot:1026577_1